MGMCEELYKTYGPIQKPTYAELRQDVKDMLIRKKCEVVGVNRSKKGEWGEWYEEWRLVNGKPEIIRETWM